jgi:hypothetical protein
MHGFARRRSLKISRKIPMLAEYFTIFLRLYNAPAFTTTS